MHHASGSWPCGQPGVVLLTLFSFFLPGCFEKPSPDPAEIRILLDRAPPTLDPRMALDANAQKLDELIFGSLTLVDHNLRVIPSFSESWSASKDGKTWSFRIQEGLKDSGDQPITSETLRECFENYRVGAPSSPQRDSFPSWIGTRSKGKEIEFDLSAPDPYFDRNVTLLRYFRQDGRPPCAPTDPSLPMRYSGEYTLLENWDREPASLSELHFVPRVEGISPLTFRITRDESVRVMELLRGSADAGLNVISLTKTHWLAERPGGEFQVLEREGVAVSYLAFQIADPILKDVRVRRAISSAIDRDSIVRYKMFGYGTLAGSFLYPTLPEAHPAEIRYDPAAAEKLLDEAGLPRKNNGERFSIRYLTTPVREGFEPALMYRDQLAKIGVRLQVEVVETGIFFSQIDKKNAPLFAARWIGVSDASIFRTTLRTGQPRNRVGYSNPEMDAWLDRHAATQNPEERSSLSRLIQEKMGTDLPYLPLWYWKNALILRKSIRGVEGKDLSMSGSFRPLRKLKR